MRILLINKSPVITQLLEFAIKDTVHTYEQTENLECSNDNFDLRIVDGLFFDNDKYSMDENKPCIILSDKHTIHNFTSLGNNTIVLKKPFLPQDILDIIESFSHEPKTAVLDKKEIGKIQQLLNNDIADIHIDQDPKHGTAYDNDLDKKEYADNISYVFAKNSKTKEKELIEAILNMKPKKLKKFLKNKNVKLTIEIKEH